MNIVKYIKKNPQLSKLFTTDGIVLITLAASGILAEFGELLPAGIVSILGFIVKIYNILVSTGILNKREEKFEEETGQTFNQAFGIENKESVEESDIVENNNEDELEGA